MEIFDALKKAQSGPVPCIWRSIGPMKVRYIKWTRNGLYEAESFGPFSPGKIAATIYTPRGDDLLADDWAVCEADRLTLTGKPEKKMPHDTSTADRPIGDAIEALCGELHGMSISIPDDAESAERVANAVYRLAQAKQLITKKQEDDPE